VSTTMTRVTATPIDASYQPATAGVALVTAPTGAITTAASGDLIPISSGRGTLLMFQTSGTPTVVTLTEVVAPPFGTGGSVTVTVGATDFQAVFIGNDGTDRFDSGVGTANVGLLQLSYTSITGLTVRAITIP
jgi:hypothetical protein